MPTPFVEVILPDAPPQLVDLTSDRVVVGSAITCQVVIERAEIAREHLLLSPRPEGCYVAVARGVPTAVMYDGAPVERVIVPWSGELTIGSVRLKLHDGNVSRAAHAGIKARALANEGGKKPINPVLLLAVGVILPLFGYLMFNTPEEELPAATTQPPALFDPLERPCEQTDPPQALRLAQESARLALAKAERMPFRVQDGIEAVEIYARAAACYRHVGDAQNTAAQLEAANALTVRLQDEYRNRQFRLQRAIEEKRASDALLEARMLRTMVTHRRGEYVTWLEILERRLQMQIDRAANSGGAE